MFELTQIITWGEPRSFMDRAFILENTEAKAYDLVQNEEGAYLFRALKAESQGVAGWLVVHFENGAAWAYRLDWGTDIEWITSALRDGYWEKDIVGGLLVDTWRSPGQAFLRKIKGKTAAIKLLSPLEV